MDVGKIALNAVKSALAFFAVGVILTFLAPPLASLSASMGMPVGPLGSAANHLWTGLYFGGFGALAAVATPLVDLVFGGDKTPSCIPCPDGTSSTEYARGRQVNINIQQAPGQSQSQSYAEGKFSRRVDTERLAMLTAENYTPDRCG